MVEAIPFQIFVSSLVAGGGDLGILFARLNDLGGGVEQPGDVLGVTSLVRRRYAGDVLRELEAGRCRSACGLGRWFIGVVFGLFVHFGRGLSHGSQDGCRGDRGV
jgi:hypothetical protein